MMKYTIVLAAALSVACTQDTSAEKPGNAAQQPIGAPSKQKAAEKIAAEYVPEATTPFKRAWFGRDINKTSCLQSASPAEKIREIQSFGQYASTNDLAGGIVEVERPLSGDRSEVWTFFPTMAQCEASLPRNQGISSKYE